MMYVFVVFVMVCSFLAFLAQDVLARDWYIKQTGVNNANCTVGAPCQTFAFMLPQVVAGDNVLLDCTGGVFTQTARLGVSITVNDGTVGNVITMKTTPACVGVSEMRPSSGVEVLGLNGVVYWTFQDFVIDGRSLGNASAPAGIGMGAGVANIIISNMLIRDVSNSVGTNSFGIATGSSSVNVRVENSVVDGTHQTAGDHEGSHCLYVSGGSDFTAVGSTFKNCGGFGIQLNASSASNGHYIARNRVFNNGLRAAGSGGGITLYHFITGSRVEANLIYKNIGPGFLVEGSNNGNHQIWNNTIVGNNPQCFTGGVDSGHPTSNVSFRNNICEANSSGAFFRAFSSGCTITNNIFSDGTAFSNTGSGNTVSGNSTSDPLLVNIAADDYHLQIGSPAIGFGVSGLGVVSDIDGVVYSVPPDVGAYVSGSAPAPAVFSPRRVVSY